MQSRDNDERASIDEPEEDDYLHRPDSEPIPGYRLIAPLGRGGFGEVWKCEAPGGLHKAIKFVHGGLHALDDSAPAEEELRAIQRVKAIRHPFLLSMERVERAGNELVIVLELADQNLADLFKAERAAGQPGIPRDLLLGYLREAAEALDVLNKQYGLQHLDVKPHNLFVISNHVKVGDFGLVSGLGASGGSGHGAITPLYASPEVFQGAVSPHSDQYSLAIVFMELLTGGLPFDGKSARALMLQHAQHEPNLGHLPEADRVVVARALAKSPADRFPSCSDFINALRTGVTEVLTPLPRAETRRSAAARTVKSRPWEAARPQVPPSAAGPLEVQDLVGRTPLSEVWKARLPDGSPRLVAVLFGTAGPTDPNVRKLTTLRHPNLMPLEVLHHTPGRLVLCQPPGERSLRDVLVAHQAEGRTGVPRRELLAYLHPIAAALEQLREKHGLQHLGLSTRNIVLEGGVPMLVGFGVAQLAWLPVGQDVAQLNARYAAPELRLRQLSPACDQYSLALVYHELLTGAFPAPGKATRRGETPVPVLDLLPASDRMLIGRALHPAPDRRWSSTLELLRALEAASEDDDPAPASQAKAAPVAAVPSAAGVMQMRFGTTLSADVIRQRLESFREQWSAREEGSGPSQVVYQMQAPRSFWQRWTGQQPGMEIAVTIGDPEVNAPAGVQTRTEVRLDLRPHDCTREQADDLLKRVGPLLVESVRQHLQQASTGRQQERLAWHHPLLMVPVMPNGKHGDPIDCQGKDISLNGIGFYIQGGLPSAQVMLLLPQTPQTPQMTVPARVVRVQSCGDGWFEVGAILQPPG